MLQALSVCAIEIGVEPHELLVGDQPRPLLAGVFLDVPARVGPIRPQASELGLVEHLADGRQRVIDCSGSVPHTADKVGYVRAPERRQDMDAQVEAIGPDRRGLVSRH